jgi:hypothetical protein
MTTYPTYFDSDIVAHTTFTSVSYIGGSIPASSARDRRRGSTARSGSATSCTKS